MENDLDGIDVSEEKILIVDDESFIRVTFSRLLEKRNYPVFTADNGIRALEMMEKVEPSVVLLDINMPQMSGLECLSLIKNKDPNVQVIMISAVDDITTGVDAIKKGALDFIVKPVKSKKLFGAVENAITKKRSLTKFDTFTTTYVMLLKEGGLVMYKKTVREDLNLDDDTFGGMFTAVKMFISDSLSVEGNLKNIKKGDHNILIEEGIGFYLIVIGKGEDVEPAISKMKEIVNRLSTDFGDIISNWAGDEIEIEGLNELMLTLE